MYLFLISIATILIYYEFIYSNQKQPPIKIAPKGWISKHNKSSLVLAGSLSIINPHKRREVMIPELHVKSKIIGSKQFDELKITTIIKPNNKELGIRKDNYWQAFIVKSKSSIDVDINISILDQDNIDTLKYIESIWLDINWLNYGPFGKQLCKDGFVIPIQFPKKQDIQVCYNQNKNKTFTIIPIKTHKLGVLDDSYKLIHEYISPVKSKGDILAIGETPLSIMQGRYIHPSNIKVTLLAKVLCYFFHPTSSLATACGMQTLINESGPTRVSIAWLIGSFFKLIGIKGIFYRLAGEQARLIDDITGTTPPYDQVIVLGPKDTKNYCQKLASELQIDVAVVDVNDLGKVKVLASNKTANIRLINEALRSNPAGNADQQTPLVIIRTI